MATETSKQTYLTPQDIGPQQVFTINDIELVIAPTQITIRNEDLVYNWRTLRTKTATKVPTGHGNVQVHATIPFTSSQLLLLHRLIVEFRHSPFCYVDNRYIRETIVPDWPLTQSMAFTITGLAIKPMPGSSDTWLCELDLTWFNYFPYLHNFLFREDWQTEYIYDGNEDGYDVSYSIGWGIDRLTYVRTHRPSPIQEIKKGDFDAFNSRAYQGDSTAAQLLGLPSLPPRTTYSAIEDDYRSKERKTIFDLEAAHPGIQFDLLPLPDNMMPSLFVSQPKNSRIYVRFINLLQRDALLKNFGIDVEEDILRFRQELGVHLEMFFSATIEDGLRKTFSLVGERMPNKIKSGWIKKMRSFNHGVRFHFHALKEIKLPDSWHERVEKQKQTRLQELVKQVGVVRDFIIPKAGELARQFDLTDAMATDIARVAHNIGADPLHLAKLINSETGGTFDPQAGATNISGIGAVGLIQFSPTTQQKLSVTREELLAMDFSQQMILVEKYANMVRRGEIGGLEGQRQQGPLNTEQALYMAIFEPDYRYVDPLTSFSEPIRQKNPHVPTVQSYIDKVNSHYELKLMLISGRGSASSTGMAPTVKNGAVGSVEPLSEEEVEALLSPAPEGEATQVDAQVVGRYQDQEDRSDFMGPVQEDELHAVIQLLRVLDSEGWRYYDRDNSVLNIWEKYITIKIAHSGADEVALLRDKPEAFTHAGIILTNVTGGLSHIVANIPILSHEYPTQQHLGSIEPMYQLEFAVLDEQGDLEGISDVAQFVQGMRSILQHNGRRYRFIMDGWCLATDTFITRMLGTYEENDFLIADPEGSVSDYELKKRTIISRTAAGTIEGSPGLSFITMDLEETNPHLQEVLVSTSPQLEEAEEARKQILNAVLGLDFIDKYKNKVMPLFVAQLANADTQTPSSPDYGKFALNVYSSTNKMFTPNMLTGFNDHNNLFVLQEGDQSFLMIRRENETQDLADDIIIGSSATELGGGASGPTSAGKTVYPVGGSNNLFELIRNSSPAALISSDGGATSWYQVPIDLSGLSDYQSTDTVAINQQEAARGLGQSDWLATRQYYDISNLLGDDPAFGTIPIERIRDYYSGIKQVLDTASRMLAEEDSGGLNTREVQKALYDLPVGCYMWQVWQAYLRAFVKRQPYLGASLTGYQSNVALAHLETLPNWPNPAGKAWKSQAPVQMLGSVDPIADKFFGWHGSPTGGISNVDNLLLNYLAPAASALSKEIDVQDGAKALHDNAIYRLVDRYMQEFPIQVWLPDLIKDKYNNLLGNLTGNFVDGQNKVPALQTMRADLAYNIGSCGNFTYIKLNGNPYFNYEEEDSEVYGGFAGGAKILNVGFQPERFRSALLRFDEIARETAAKLGVDPTTIGLADYLAPVEQIGNKPGSPFVYRVDRDAELLKIRYIKQLLAAFADDLRADPAVLEAFGLEHLILTSHTQHIRGTQCYPDLVLPTHPFYGDSFQVYPDFYMWNIYDDGGAFGRDDQDDMYRNVKSVVDRCYESITKMQEGEARLSTDDIVVSSDVEDPIHRRLELRAEGTDWQKDGSGASSSPFAPTKASGLATPGTSASEQLGDLTKTKPEIRLSSAEQGLGAGAGLHYPSRAHPAVYSELEAKVSTIESMFGSRAGYQNQYIDAKNTPEILNRTDGTNLQRPLEYAHTFDKDSLNSLARDSSKDLLSRKMCLRRAFPTFKLFFVEEDEAESRLLNFDDFYTYNAVKEFTVVQSRKLPADHAVIVVQNVSGTLDGTKRNSITDLDYYDRTAGKKIEEGQAGVGASSRSGNPVTQNTAQEQPFGSIILRPGLNVQLRCGFSNDPDNLHVMLSGRVVDVNWNKTGDLAEIMVQSFGTELVQVIKGTTRYNPRTYPTTHALLGSMMLEPELTHFGRWEFGQLFQVGESSDSRLDFTDYSKEGHMGRFQATNNLTRWALRHPFITAGGVVGAELALSFLPLGRMAKGIPFLGKFVGGKGVPIIGRNLMAARGASGFRIAITDGLTRAGIKGGIVTQAERKLVNSIVATELRGTYNVAMRSATPEARKVLSGTARELYKNLDKAGSIEEVVTSVAKFERYLQTYAYKGKWMAKPWISSASGAVEVMSSLGTVPFTKAFKIIASGVGAGVAVAATAGLSIDISGAFIRAVIDNLGLNFIDKARRFFTRAKVHFFLSPQDDNLYPPHPKDYMKLDRGLVDEAVELSAELLGRTLFESLDAGKFLYRVWNPEAFISKKVTPTACDYTLTTSTIWDVFHEMSLRHPGWVYGPRPYGLDFRYTMFFGPPAQRYWARGASNSFIHRVNKLRQYLEGKKKGEFEITEAEFKALYGLDVFSAIKERVHYESGASYVDTLVDTGILIDNSSQIDDQDPAYVEEKRMKQIMTGAVLQEYLRALEIRFLPFRRYHMFTSNTDIVWNGIIGSERSVTNAVDVVYTETPLSQVSAPAGPAETHSAVFKAHAFIPENQLRIAPIRYDNCVTYEMAMRYGMGELMHRMKDMYRGELIILGNPRVRPWDVGIIIDTYNDMVGPIEVEQVVHNFSHETGFITEIKPSAVVFGNEISGWPIVEAMKMFSLAVQDIQDRHAGVRGERDIKSHPTVTSTLTNIISSVPPFSVPGVIGPQAPGVPRDALKGIFGDDATLPFSDQRLFDQAGKSFDTFMHEKYRRTFGAAGASLQDTFGDNPPNVETFDRALADVQNFVNKSAIGGGGLVGGALGIAGVMGAVNQWPALGAALKSTSSGLYTKKGKLALFAAGTLGAATGAAATNSLLIEPLPDFPSLAWLIGGPILLLQCLRNDAIIVVPLMKNGHPVVAGVAYNDPNILWNQIRGQLNRFLDDSLTGAGDMISLYMREGSSMWRRMGDVTLQAALTDKDFVDQTGGSQFTPQRPGE